MVDNKKISQRFLISTFLMVICILSIFGINGFKHLAYKYIENTNNTIVDKQSDTKVSAWIAYWDTNNAINELTAISKNIDSIENFAAYFDKDNVLFIPDENKKILSEVKPLCKKNDIKIYLTIVNDRINNDGSSILKDSELLTKLLDTERSRKNHIDNIVKLAIDGEYNGVEIDYEKIDKDTVDEFILFCENLYKRLNENGIELRIVLEPKEMFENLKFPKGPDYVMMVYNLYDANSNPGPKADQDLIAKAVKIMNKIPGEKWLAFANGGFDWEEGKKATTLTEVDASELLKVYKIKPERDKKSGCMHFNYIDEKKVKHVVWYVDKETLKLWIETAKKHGYYNISIWRLGGNEEKFLEYVKQID